MEAAEEVVPARLPITDSGSRITPNKDGGFAPNYTPLATVDVDSGIIVSADVIPHTDESKHLIRSMEQTQEHFSLASPPGEVLADGMMATGENLEACDSRGITLYSPLKGMSQDGNPAVREDPTQPVAEEDVPRLPRMTFKTKGEKRCQIAKQAFVYDEEQNCYWCPQGKSLRHTGTTQEKTRTGRPIQRHRFKAKEADCQSCPLRQVCLRGKAKRRQINHEQYEELRIAHAKRMSTDEAQQRYARRRHPGERPFAVIKQTFGARQFLLRGIGQVKQEWLWLTTAFNLHRLIGLKRGGIGPPIAAPT
jgi:hypothetical protein